MHSAVKIYMLHRCLSSTTGLDSCTN